MSEPILVDPPSAVDFEPISLPEYYFTQDFDLLFRPDVFSAYLMDIHTAQMSIRTFVTNSSKYKTPERNVRLRDIANEFVRPIEVLH